MKYFADATDGGWYTSYTSSNRYYMYNDNDDEEEEYCEECGEELEDCECHDGDGTIWQCPKAIEFGGKCPDTSESCEHSTPHEFIVDECFAGGENCPICIQIPNETFLSKEDMEI